MKNLFPALTRAELFTGFGIKMLMGWLYGYVFLHFFPGDDTVFFHLTALEQTDILRSDPLRFFYEEYTPFPSIARSDNFAEILVYYLNDLEYALVIKTTAILNLVSQGNYYINVVFFNMLVFPGSYWLFRSMHTVFPDKRRWIYLAVFCFLPAVFWLSGIRSDGWLLFFLALLLFHLTAGRRHRTAGVIAGLLGILILRPQFALLLLPALAGYYLSIRCSRKKDPLHPGKAPDRRYYHIRFPRLKKRLAGEGSALQPPSRLPGVPVWLIFAGVYFFFALAFFASPYLLPGGGLPDAMARRQELFATLEGTAYRLDPLQPSLTGFLKLAPQAVLNSLLRPFIWEAKGPFQVMAALSTLLWWIIIMYAWLNREKDWRRRLSHPVALMVLGFSLSVYLSIGYVVPFPGAIVRYRVTAELLLLCCGMGILKRKPFTTLAPQTSYN